VLILALPIDRTTTQESPALPPPEEPVPSLPPPPPPPAPKPKVVYDKSIQTTPDLFPHSVPTSTSSGAQTRHLNDGGEDAEGGGGGAGRETSDELRSRIIAELEQERQQLDREIAEEKRLAQLAQDETLKKGLSPPELETIFSSTKFTEFLEDSTKVVQRALSESYDYLRDYTIVDDEGREDAEGRKQRVRLLGSWRDEGWGKGRSVTAIDWSPKVRLNENPARRRAVRGNELTTLAEPGFHCVVP
jgi:dynein intermediate chain